MVRFPWSIDFRWSGIHSRSAELSQKMTINPTTTPVTAAGFPARFTIRPRRKSPSIPPAKIPDSFHQISRIFAASFVKNSAVPVPRIPQKIVDHRSTFIDSTSPTSFPPRISRPHKSRRVIVAELFKLVSIVLIAAAAKAARINPPTPGGR